MIVYAPHNLDSYDSYGLIACELLRHLDALGVDVYAVALGDVHHANQSEDVRRITNKPIRASLGGIFLGYPTTYTRHNPLADMGPRIAITMFESSKIPQDWIEPLNGMDAVIVPSQFCKDGFLNSGVSTRIHVVPLGICDVFKPVWRSFDGPYTFLAIGDRGKRKGALEAIHAFHTAFGDDPKYRLIVKARDVEGQRVNILNDNIDVIYEDMSLDALYGLYLQAHCMVFPARGEGFGLPPREFAATGAPAIATNWSGLADDIELWGIPLGYRLSRADWQGAKNLQGQDLGMWADPNVEQLTRLMKNVAGWRVNYQRMAMSNAPLVKRLYDWHRFAREVLNIWNGVTHGHRNATTTILA